MSTEKPLILVTGATGAQGGATARELLASGFRVRFLTRNPDSAAAQALVDAGAEAIRGDLEAADTVASAVSGCQGVFSVQIPDSQGTDAERRHAFTLIDAAKNAGVTHFVHTSVCEAGKHTAFPRWESGYWWQKYWTDKWDIEQAVRAAGFEYWTILKPAFMMDNFALPKSKYMFPHLRQGKIITALLPTTRMQLIAASDVGILARAAFSDPDYFNQQNLDLAVEALTMAEVASILARVLGKPVVAESVSPETAVESGLFAGWVRSQEWTNEVGYRADIAALEHTLGNHGIDLTSFERWVNQHAKDIRID
ncbi:NmrA/HSCARG family protein [Pseudomonas citronellolis]|uniref:NmrA/HSCARG family protein n=1 Tax=Pseudomonas citronellolis TaxID=53408 RepID=UPI0021C05207|nr:NmrA/HSCARG family protein [Pseudomonas citronellolis]UXJ50162.1 NmrA/HSCARG family protein [Pseudomonas citronellolis]